VTFYRKYAGETDYRRQNAAQKRCVIVDDIKNFLTFNIYYTTVKCSYVRSISCDRRLLASLCANIQMYRRATA
jgi:uncharacterized CHY-type Zn-finger protein